MSWRSAAIATFLTLANSVSPAIGAPDITTCDEVDLAVTTSPVPPQFSKNLRRHYWLRDLLPGGPVDFLLIGDSLVEMWPQEAWTASFPDTTVLNLGVGGDTTQNVLWRLSKMPLTRIQPRSVALLIGTNNLSHKDKPCAILVGIEAILSTIRQAWPEVMIYVIAIPPRGFDWQDKAAARQIMNIGIRDLADRSPGVPRRAGGQR